MKSARDIGRYLKSRDWESTDDLGLVRLWRHPAYSGKHWIPTQDAVILTQQDIIQRLESDVHELRAKVRALKADRADLKADRAGIKKTDKSRERA